jgi:hypothetical protein
MSLIAKITTLEDYDRLVEEYAQGKRVFAQACSRCTHLEEEYLRFDPDWQCPPAETYVVGGRRYSAGLCRPCGEIEANDRRNRRAAQEAGGPTKAPAANSPNRYPRQDRTAPPLPLVPRPLPAGAQEDFRSWHDSTGDR